MKYDHRGHEIVFDVESEEWKCGSLALADKSLKALQKAIDREGKKRRRVDVEVYWLSEGYSRRHHGGRYVHSIRAARIVLLRDGDRKADIKVDGERGQHQVDLSDLYAPDQKPLLEKFIAAKEAEQKASDQVSVAQDRLESMTAKAVREAVARQADKET